MGHRGYVSNIYSGATANRVFKEAYQLKLVARIDNFSNHFLPKRLIFEPVAR